MAQDAPLTVILKCGSIRLSTKGAVKCPKENYPHGTKTLLSKRDKARLDKAVEIAKTSLSRSRHGSSRHGAMIVAGGRTISVGVNTD